MRKRWTSLYSGTFIILLLLVSLCTQGLDAAPPGTKSKGTASKRPTVAPKTTAKAKRTSSPLPELLAGEETEDNAEGAESELYEPYKRKSGAAAEKEVVIREKEESDDEGDDESDEAVVATGKKDRDGKNKEEDESSVEEEEEPEEEAAIPIIRTHQGPG